MYGAGNPQMAALGALGALGGSLRSTVMAPVSNWSQASLTHKIVAAGAGAGLAYYLHQKGMADVAVAAAGIGGAYATSMLMHYSRSMGTQSGAALPNGQSAAALPSEHVQNMTEQANAVIAANGGQDAANGVGRWSALGPAAKPGGVPQAQQQQPAPPAPVASAGMGNTDWSALG